MASVARESKALPATGTSFNRNARVLTHAWSPPCMEDVLDIRQAAGPACRRGPVPWNSDRPFRSAFASRLTPPVFERRAALLWTVDFAAAEFTDGEDAVVVFLAEDHGDRLHSLTGSRGQRRPAFVILLNSLL